MNAHFFDRQDRQNPRNGLLASDPNELLSWIDEMRNRPPFFCELVGENGFNLLIGLGERRGCTQYSAGDGSPPYLMAVGDDYGSDEFMEFLSGNTDTPVSIRYCLPIVRIKQIIADFMTTGERSPSVSWEEI